MTTSTNPLQKHFRQPAIHIKLPSNGAYWADNSIDIPVTGSIGVYPMTALDEITLRTPDSLFSGQSTVDVIQSCIPAIKNAWNIPSVDIDALLIAIRIASHGHNLEISSTCPDCKETADFEYDLRLISDSFVAPDYSKPFVFNEVEISLKPMTYKDITDNNIIQFEERKVYQINADQSIAPEDKLKQINESFKRITELSINAIAKSVNFIKINDAVATEQEHITEYLKNCDSKLYTALRDYIVSLKAQTEVKPLHIKCPACGHEYDSPFALDTSNFFG